MRLVRYGRAGAEKPGLVDAEGTVRDLSRVVRDLTPTRLSVAGLTRLRGLKVARLPVVKGRPRLGCPLAGIGKMVCIGLNYTDHAEEVGLPLPIEPTVFIKEAAHWAAGAYSSSSTSSAVPRSETGAHAARIRAASVWSAVSQCERVGPEAKTVQMGCPARMISPGWGTSRTLPSSQAVVSGTATLFEA